VRETQSEVSRRKRDKDITEQPQHNLPSKRRESKDRDSRRQEKVPGKREETGKGKRKQTQKQSQQDVGHRQPLRQNALRRQQQQQIQQPSNRSQYEVPPRFRHRQAQPSQQEGPRHKQSDAKYRDVTHVPNGGLDKGFVGFQQPARQTADPVIGLDPIETWELETVNSAKEDQIVADSDGTDGSLNGSANTLDLLKSGLTELREPAGPISDTASLLTSANWTPTPQSGSLAPGVVGAWNMTGNSNSTSAGSASANQVNGGKIVSPLVLQTAQRAQKQDREKGKAVRGWGKGSSQRRELPRTPPSEVTSGQENSGEKWLRLLMDMGFQEEQVLKALGNNPDSFDEVLGDLLAISAVEEQNTDDQALSERSTVKNVYGSIANHVQESVELDQTEVEEEHFHSEPVMVNKPAANQTEHNEKHGEFPVTLTELMSSQGQAVAPSQSQLPSINPLLQQLLIQLQLQQLTPQLLASQLMALQRPQEMETKHDSVKNDKQQTALLPGTQLLLQQQQQQQQLSLFLSLLQGFHGLPNPLAFPQLPSGPMSFPQQGLPAILQQLQRFQQAQSQAAPKVSESTWSANTSEGSSKPVGDVLSTGDKSESEKTTGPRLLKLVQAQNGVEVDSKSSNPESKQQPQDTISSDDWPLLSSDLLSKSIDSMVSTKNLWGSDGLTTLSSIGSQTSESERRLEMPSVGDPPVDIQLDFLTSPDDMKSSVESCKLSGSPHWSLTDKSVAHIGPPAFEPGKMWPGLSGDEGANKAENEEEIPSLIVKPQTHTVADQAPLAVQPPPKAAVASSQMSDSSSPRKWSSGKDGPPPQKGPLLATPPYPPSLPPTMAVPPSNTARPLPPFGTGLQSHIPFAIAAPDLSSGSHKQGILGAPPHLANGAHLPGMITGFPGFLPMMPSSTGRPSRPSGLPKNHPPKSVASVRPVPHTGPQSTNTTLNLAGKVGGPVKSTTPWAFHSESTAQNAVSSPKKSSLPTTTSSQVEATASDQRAVSTPSSPQLRTSWVLLKNIPKQFDMDTLRSFCQQHGPLKAFETNSCNGTALVKYSSTSEAEKAKTHLHLCPLSGTAIDAQLVGETDLALFYEQLPAAPVVRNAGGISKSSPPPTTTDTMRIDYVPPGSTLKSAGLAGVQDVQASGMPSFDTNTDSSFSLDTKAWPLGGVDGLPPVSTNGLSGLWSSNPTNINTFNPWIGPLESLPGKAISGESTYSQTLSGRIYGGDSA
jgi:hypothetical protein